MSPILLNKMYCNEEYKEVGYDEKEDIWSLGIICYQLLVGEHPFNSDNLNELVNKVNVGDYSMPITLSREAISFIISMLKFDSQKRISVDELYNHEFLRKNVKEFNKLNLDTIKQYEDDSKIKINTKNDRLIEDILAKSVSETKEQEN